jgi:putative transposase
MVRRRSYRRPCCGRPVHAPRVVVVESDNFWTADFKGWWRTGDGARFEPLTVRDAASRFVLALRVLERNGTDAVRAVFEELFECNSEWISLAGESGSHPGWRRRTATRPASQGAGAVP